MLLRPCTGSSTRCFAHTSSRANSRREPATATRPLADALKVGRNTVIAAYQQLLIEGYLESRSGSGTWVADVMEHAPAVKAPSARGAPSRFSRRGATILKQPQFGRRPHKINFQPGFPEVETFPFSTWARLLAHHARSRSEELLSYYHFAGHPALRDAIAGYVGMARGVDCCSEQVIVVTGAQAALDLLARTLMDDGDVAWMEEPGYIGARTALLAGGARLAPLRVGPNGWAISSPELPHPRNYLPDAVLPVAVGLDHAPGRAAAAARHR